MTDLTDWLLEQIAADEAVARDAEDCGAWEVRPYLEGSFEGEVVVASVDGPNSRYNAVCGAEYEGYHSTVEPGNAAHIATHDPARVLAECAAKRSVIELRESWAQQVDRSDGLAAALWEAHVNAVDAVLRRWASVFRDRPGWRPEWGA